MKLRGAHCPAPRAALPVSRPGVVERISGLGLVPSGTNGTNDSWISGSEGSGNYLELSAEEIELLKNLKALKDNGTFKSIVVLINSSNALEMDFLNPAICGEDYGIDAAMWIGDVGQTGINGVGQLLAGTVTPSGSLVDTYLWQTPPCTTSTPRPTPTQQSTTC